MRSHGILVSALLFGALQLGVPGSAFGDETGRRPRPASGPGTFGTTQVAHTLGAFGFTGLQAVDLTRFASTGTERYCVGDECHLVAPVVLPAGARLTSIELSACDTHLTWNVVAQLWRVASPGGFAEVIGFVQTGGLPGCVYSAAALAIPETIDNYNNSYHVRLLLESGDSTNRFEAVRLFYTLQVSPAPAVATFDDVPTSHPFFQVIEALSASGITAGCNSSPPLYCPSAPVTRAQMAAFLSVALGLHW